MIKKLTNDELILQLGICECNSRFVDDIRSALIFLKDSIENKEDISPTQRILIALLDDIGFITHGVNIEYPIFVNLDDFWNKL